MKKMKKVVYTRLDGTKFEVEYDETAPCIICGEPVGSASMGGTVICLACDCGKCRFCGIPLPMDKNDIKLHMKWHKRKSKEFRRTPIMARKKKKRLVDKKEENRIRNETKDKIRLWEAERKFKSKKL